MKLFRAVSENPDMEEVLELAVSDFLEELHTCLPGRIHSYDAELQRAQVQPVTHDYYWDPDAEELVAEKYPVCVQVPIMWPSSNGGSSITFPLEKGDPVLLVFSERSIAEYLVNGNLDNIPSSARAFDLSDAFAIPGGRSFNTSSEHAAPIPAEGLEDDAVVLRGDGIALRAQSGFSLESGGEELLAVLEELRDQVESIRSQLVALAASQVPTAIGPQPLPPGAAVATAMGLVKTELDGIALKLTTLKR